MRRGDPVALLLARRWARTFAVLLAVGAVSGTIISFEMGLLWRAGQCLPAARPGRGDVTGAIALLGTDAPVLITA